MKSETNVVVVGKKSPQVHFAYVAYVSNDLRRHEDMMEITQTRLLLWLLAT